MSMMRLKVNESSINRFPIKKEKENLITVHVIFVTFMVKIGDKSDIGHWSPYIAICKQIIVLSIDVSILVD